MGWNVGGFGAMRVPSPAGGAAWRESIVSQVTSNDWRAIATSLAVALVACSTPRPVAPPSAPVRPPNHCAAVADRLLAIYGELRHTAPDPTMATTYRDVVVERCTQDVWPAAAQDCIVAPRADVDACTQLLTPEQRASFAEAAQRKLNAAGTAATGSGH